MQGRRQGRHLVSYYAVRNPTIALRPYFFCKLTVDGVEVEELLDLVGNLRRRVVRGVVFRRALAVDAPVVHEPLEHAERAELVELAEAAKDGQLLVGHAHVYFMSVSPSCLDISKWERRTRFVTLDIVLGDGLLSGEKGSQHTGPAVSNRETYKLGGWDSRQEFVEAGQAKARLGPSDEALQVGLVNGADGILVQLCE